MKRYPEDYDELVDYGRAEPDEDSRPVLSSHVDNMEEYEIIFLGFPNWLEYHNLIQCTQHRN